VRNYDVSLDGQQFLVLKAGQYAEAGDAPYAVVLNGFDRLRQRVPRLVFSNETPAGESWPEADARVEMVFDMTDPSQIPQIAEPPVMNADDLKKALSNL
jgi:hypothetical protein